MKKRFWSHLFLLTAILALLSLVIFSGHALATIISLNNNSNWNSGLIGSLHSSLVLGDIDGDGDMDLISGGCLSGGVDTCSTSDIIRIYLNNGSGFAENVTWEQNLTNITFGSLALGDIDNDGDLDLIRAGNINTTFGFIRVYLNNGTSFEENQTWAQNFSGITNAFGSSVALGDVDNDGKLDLALIGADSISRNGIYINNGTSFVKNSVWLASLPLAGQGGGNGALAFGDVDNDGRLDLVMAGSRYTNWYTGIYVNNGTSLEENSTWGNKFYPYFAWPSLVLGDYGNDGNLDLMIIGTRTGDHYYIYENNITSFVINETEASNGYCCLIGYYAGSIHMGDYNNDGYLDSAVMGRENGRNRVFKNYFTNISQSPYGVVFDVDSIASDDIHKDDLQRGSLAWFDLNNDTHLDLVITGFKGNTGPSFTYVYVSNKTENNTQPQPPNSSFLANYENDEITFSWGNGSDNETPTAGLYYNLRVGTTSGGNQIVSGVYGGSSNPTAGYFGNMMQRKSITLHGDWLQANATYYWSVQTIDTGLAKSAWSTEQTYTTSIDITYPSITLNSPEDNNYTSFDNITVNITASDNVNISNVSLYGSWGGWHRNETNSSGLNGSDYLFQANLTGFPEGIYVWAIEACDTTGNCRLSNNRTVIRDLYSPIIYLESPSNGSSWTSNNSVTFRFNATDIALANCSLIVNGSPLYNFSSPVINTSHNTTLTLSNGNYNWSVNCTDMLNRTNSSGIRQLTVNYQAPETPSSNGGGGGGIISKTYEAGDLQENTEATYELRANDKIEFHIAEQTHNLEVKKVYSESAFIEISSEPVNFTLGIGESRKLNLSSSQFYDLFVRLNSIRLFKANITIRKIHEAIALSEGQEQEEQPEQNETIEETPEEQKIIEHGNPMTLAAGIVIGVIALTAGLAAWILNRRDKKKTR